MTILRPALAESLRGLKLSGMLETLDAPLAQAQGGDLGYPEFLQILCDDEITRREQQGMARRLRRARFEVENTLEGFDFTASPKLPAAQIRDLAALRRLQAGESIILYGAVGSRQDPRRPGPRPSRDPRRCRGYELISQRIAEGRSIAITANRAPQDCYPLFPNPVVAESLLDRLINTSHQVFMNGPPYRPNKRPRRRSPKREWAPGLLPRPSAH